MSQLVSVIAGGWSLKGVDLAKIPGFRIGVNESAWRTRCDAGVTMDRLFFEGRHDQLVKAFPIGRDAPFYFRNGIDKAGHAAGHWLPYDCDNESSLMSIAWDPRVRLNGRNSGICGINLAFRIAPARVILWGFDMCRSPFGQAYYHAPYPWAPGGSTKPGKYIEWSQDFAFIREQFDAAGIELINASPNSAINSIKKVDPRKLLA